VDDDYRNPYGNRTDRGFIPPPTSLYVAIVRPPGWERSENRFTQDRVDVFLAWMRDEVFQILSTTRDATCDVGPEVFATSIGQILLAVLHDPDVAGGSLDLVERFLFGENAVSQYLEYDIWEATPGHVVRLRLVRHQPA
jgi:hypothetical protein